MIYLKIYLALGVLFSIFHTIKISKRQKYLSVSDFIYAIFFCPIAWMAIVLLYLDDIKIWRAKK